MKLEIESFNPNVAELQRIVSETSVITESHGLDAVKEARALVVRTRTSVQKIGKEMRDEANKFAKSVIAKEKELTSILEPEEERLKGIEAKMESDILREKRKLVIPHRKAELASIGDQQEVTDDELLDMDDTMFVQYKANRIIAWQQYESQRLADERRKLDEEKERIAREERIRAEAEERARKEADARVDAERRAKDVAEMRLAQEKERQEKERIAREASEALEQERLARNERYQDILKKHGADKQPEKFHIETKDTLVRVFMLTGEYDIG